MRQNTLNDYTRTVNCTLFNSIINLSYYLINSQSIINLLSIYHIIFNTRIDYYLFQLSNNGCSQCFNKN